MIIIMENMYKVFKVDICFDPYAMDDDYIGAESKEDLYNHLQDIYKYEETIKHEDWMSAEDWNDVSECGKYKDGDIVIEYKFTNEQMQNFKESLNDDFSRIEEVPHMFTDTPYEILDGCGYIE